MRTYRDNHKEYNKRELHPIIKCAILFFLVFFFSIIIVNNSNEETRIHNNKISNQVGTGNGSSATIQDGVSSSGILVAIDPGHGGNDPGKVSADGILEKDINLQIALVLKMELEERGMSTVILRETDVNLATQGATNKKSSDMKNRVAIINESQPDVLISVHQNSYTDPDVRGPQVFYHSSSEESQTFAKALQEKLKIINPEFSREAKEGNDYYILNKTICPGVIVECGFLSCPEETALLVSEEYQQKIASAIADAIEETY